LPYIIRNVGAKLAKIFKTLVQRYGAGTLRCLALDSCFQNIRNNTVVDTVVVAIPGDQNELDVLEYILMVLGHPFQRFMRPQCCL